MGCGGERYFACEAWDNYGSNSKLGRRRTETIDDVILRAFEREPFDHFPITINEVEEYVESWTGQKEQSGKKESGEVQQGRLQERELRADNPADKSWDNPIQEGTLERTQED